MTLRSIGMKAAAFALAIVVLSFLSSKSKTVNDVFNGPNIL